MENAITYGNFIPSSKDDQLCSKFLVLVEELAPSDSNVGALIDRLADRTYRTVISIQAACGKFSVVEFGSSAKDSLCSAQKSILAKLDDWKRTRFLAV